MLGCLQQGERLSPRYSIDDEFEKLFLLARHQEGIKLDTQILEYFNQVFQSWPFQFEVDRKYQAALSVD